VQCYEGKKSHAIPLTPTIARTIGNHSFAGWSEGRKKRELLALSQTSGWTLHDLRKTTATRMAELGIAPHIIERLLAHQSGVVSGIATIYNRPSYMLEMRDALQKWETRVHTLLFETESYYGRENIPAVRTA